MAKTLFWTAAAVFFLGVSLGVGNIDTILIDFSQLPDQSLLLVKLASFTAGLGCLYEVIK